MEDLVINPLPDPAFWRGRRVFLTGHTGFKGTWARLWLTALGASVYGYALPSSHEPALGPLTRSAELAGEALADIRDGARLETALAAADPEIILHLAAQPLVLQGYTEPVETFDINVMGTVRLLEAARSLPSLLAALVVTTDKVYANSEEGRHFRENDHVGGHDPYSASKAACEIAVASYRASFFRERGVYIATARGGNVLGGGDFSPHRLIPDVVRAARAGRSLEIRNPLATRPWQYVLDCLCGYLLFCEALARRTTQVESLNFGPSPAEKQLTVADIAAEMQRALGLDVAWKDVSAMPTPPEMKTLGLDPGLAAATLGWYPRFTQTKTVSWTARWYADWHAGADPRALSLSQIAAFTRGH